MSADSTPYGLPVTAIEKLARLFASCPGIERVILYGSRAKGSFRPGSDIDLTIEGEGVTLAAMLDLEQRIDDLLLPYKVDLSLLHLLKDADLLAHIRRVGVVLYERKR